MGKYVLAYKGGSMAATEAEQKAAMQSWMDWFGGLGAAVVEVGSPFGPSTAVGSDGATTSASAGLTGYSVVEADDLDRAAVLTKGCPIFAGGGSVEVYEAIEM
jgi:hypothetical protein